MENVNANLQKVDTMLFKNLKTLPVDKDRKAGIEHLSKARKRDLGSITFT